MVGNVPGFGIANLAVDAGILGIVGFGYASVEFDDADIEQQRLLDRSTRNLQLGFFCLDDLVDAAGRQADRQAARCSH